MRVTRALSKWIMPGIGLKRWIGLLLTGVAFTSIGLAFAIVELLTPQVLAGQSLPIALPGAIVLLVGGLAVVMLSIIRLLRVVLAPYRRLQNGSVIDVVYAHSKRHKGAHIVAIGGGTGLPAVLRGLKAHTSNLTAVVTVADDGGSSGRLRRDLGVLPPGDLRNNIAALADDESLMTRLFQYRFDHGDLGGHAFGNLFISALSGVTGSLETALIETGRVLNIQGRVFPATLDDITLVATIRANGEMQTVRGESRITQTRGTIETITLAPPHAQAYVGSVKAIESADIVVVGPGSLFTSLLPNILVDGIRDALRATPALKIYVVNIATQPGETENYNVADHILTLERYIGRGVFQLILANNHYPTENAGVNTRYVQPAPEGHEILQRYTVHYHDLVDAERPWRHDPRKLANAILSAADVIHKPVSHQTKVLHASV